MADYFIESETLAAIADAIREQIGETDVIYPEQMSEKIHGNLGNVKKLVGRTITNIRHDGVKSVGPYAFYNYTDLNEICFPNCNTVDSSAFIGCNNIQSCTLGCETVTSTTFPFKVASSALTALSFPKCTLIDANTFSGYKNLNSAFFPACSTVSDGAFANCTNLTSTDFFACKIVGKNAFASCTNLAYIDFPMCETIGESAFYNCTNLTAVLLGGSSVVDLANVNAFVNTPITNSSYVGIFGGIYVTPSLVNMYRTDKRWINYASRIEAIPEINNFKF